MNKLTCHNCGTGIVSLNVSYRFAVIEYWSIIMVKELMAIDNETIPQMTTLCISVQRLKVYSSEKRFP
ncbi:MAG: hypothetical protein ACUZ8H_01945 [Candidatus Anammoxibacter sp.]